MQKQKSAVKSVYIQTYGCSNNQAESQIMAGLLKEKGYALVGEENSADVVILNTCSVKNKTENKIIHRLSTFESKHPGKKLVVAGCLPEADIERVRKNATGASIVGTNHIRKITDAVDLLLEGSIVELVGQIDRQAGNIANAEKIGLPKARTGVIDIVPISSGCASFCSFCSTKLAKGNLLSYSEENIVNEIRTGKIGHGAKEFWLTSQDCGCYGFELRTNAANLLNNITKNVSGEYYLRLGMANPQHVKKIFPELIEAYRNRHVFKFLHVPVQSGSDEILKKMKRGHTAEDYYRVVEEFRRAFPEITIWTDIIVGFPGETEGDFELSMKLLRETRPDIANISAFSSRHGTKAAKMRQLPSEVVKERTGKMSSLAEKACFENNRAWLGWKGTVLVDEYKPKKENFIGRNYAYKPVVLKGECELGQVVDVKITEITSNCLIGEHA